jgi:hypothetical protein
VGERERRGPAKMRGEANGVDHGEDRRRGEEEEPQQQGQAEEEAQAGRPSSGRQQQQPAAVATRNVGYVGKHRLSAAIQRLDQELQSLQVRPPLPLLSRPCTFSNGCFDPQL